MASSKQMARAVILHRLGAVGLSVFDSVGLLTDEELLQEYNKVVAEKQDAITNLEAEAVRLRQEIQE